MTEQKLPKTDYLPCPRCQAANAMQSAWRGSNLLTGRQVVKCVYCDHVVDQPFREYYKTNNAKELINGWREKANVDPLFIGAFPGGMVYADRTVEVNGDYKRLGFMPWSTLELQLEPNVRKDLAERITEDVAQMQKRRGQFYQLSASGQGVLLGGAA